MSHQIKPVDIINYRKTRRYSVLANLKNELRNPTRRNSPVSIKSLVLSRRHSKINQYKKLYQLGQGSFAHVYLAKHRKNGDQFAIKQMNKKALKRRKQGMTGLTAYDSVKEELKVL